MSSVLGAALCAGLLGGVVSPVWAAESGDGHGSWPVGGFALGDGIEGLMEEGSGGFSFALPAGGMSLGWDSRRADVDRYGFGEGWSVAGAGFVDVLGGVRVFPASGGVFEADASVPSGLSGYVLQDLRFEQAPGVLPARADGFVPERAYRFRLVELGGAVSWFDAVGDPIARVDGFGNRMDWTWGEGGSHRLTGVVTDVGVVTDLDWSDPGLVEVSTRAGAGAPESVSVSVSAVKFDGGRVVGVTDPVGGRTAVGYTPAGLVSRLGGVSGAATDVSWQRLPDGRVAVDRVRVADPVTGEVLSERMWGPVAGLASGWPGVHDAAGAGESFSTVVSDGVTRIVSEYSDRGVLAGRKVVAGDPSGERVLQEQVFEYPGDDGGGLPPQADRPTRSVFTHWNAVGGSRVVEEGFEFDELGRMVRHAAADGTVTETTYDDQIPGREPGEEIPDGGVPIGLPLLERVVAFDGLVSESRYELNPARTAVVAAETWTGTTSREESGDALTRAGRAEYDVADDGFVTVERAFPQGGAGEAVVTVREKVVDLGSGELTLTETVAAGTELAAKTTTESGLLHGHPVAVTDVMGNRVTTEYDEAGRVVRAEDAAGLAMTSEYRTAQQHGVNATIVTAPDGVVTTTESDVLGRVRRTVDNIDHGTATPGHVHVVESRSYPDPGVVVVTDAWGATTRAEHDGLGRPVKTVAPSGLTEITTYDDATQEQTSGLTPTGNLADAEAVTTSRSDERERVATTTGIRRDGIPVLPSTSNWDGFGRETSTTDSGTTTRTEFDGFGNPTTTTVTPGVDTDAHTDLDADGLAGPQSLVASRDFDAFGVSVQKTLSDATGTRSAGRRELDVLGRTIAEIDPAGTTTEYAYTPDGLTAAVHTSAGQATTNSFDGTTRQLIQTVTTSPVGASVRTGFDYDAETGAVIAVFDPADRDGTVIAYESDAWGNTTSVSYPDGTEVRYRYDAHGRREWVRDVAGIVTRSVYTGTGELAAVTQEDGSDEVLARVGYAYDAYGRVESLTRGNGTSTAYAYTSRSEIASEVTTDPAGTVDTRREYAYAATGTLTTRTDMTRDAESGTEEVTTTSYRYDGFDRLVGSTVHDGSTTKGPVRTRVEYALSVSGDLTRETSTEPGVGGGEVTVREYGYTPGGHLTTLTTTNPDGSVILAGQEYDSVGNPVLGHDGTKHAYDAQNRPVAETTPTGEVVRTGYWASGQRRHLTAVDAGTGIERQTRFYWDGTSLLADTHTTDTQAMEGAGRAAGSYLSGLMRHARTTTDPDTVGTDAVGTDAVGTVYYGHDRHGNVTDLTTGAGAVAARYGYDDYGASLPQSGEAKAPAASLVGEVRYQPFGYAGEYTNPTGTQHLQVRTYDPGTRRFQQLDLADQHNPYWYGNANPVTHIDPSGQTSKIDWLAVSLAAVGLALSLIGLATAAYAVGAATAAAMAAGGGWAAVAVGTKLALGATLAVAVVDATLTTMLTVDELATDIFDDDVALGLGIGGAALGGVGLLAGGVSKMFSARKIARPPQSPAAGQGGPVSQLLKARPAGVGPRQTVASQTSIPSAVPVKPKPRTEPPKFLERLAMHGEGYHKPPMGMYEDVQFELDFQMWLSGRTLQGVRDYMVFAKWCARKWLGFTHPVLEQHVVTAARQSQTEILRSAGENLLYARKELQLVPSGILKQGEVTEYLGQKVNPRLQMLGHWAGDEEYYFVGDWTFQHKKYW